VDDIKALLANYRSAVARVEATPEGGVVPRGRIHREMQARMALLNHVSWAIYNAKIKIKEK